MLRRLLFLFVATLMTVVACDGNPGDEPGDTYPADTSTGKGDGPNPTDTTNPDTATPTDTNPPSDIVQVEDPCKDLYQYDGFYWGDDQKGHSEYDDTLTLTVSPSEEKATCLITAEGSILNYPIIFEGREEPLDYLEWNNVSQAEYLFRLWRTDHYTRITYFNGTEDTDPIDADFWFVKSQ